MILEGVFIESISKSSKPDPNCSGFVSYIDYLADRSDSNIGIIYILKKRTMFLSFHVFYSHNFLLMRTVMIRSIIFFTNNF